MNKTILQHEECLRLLIERFALKAAELARVQAETDELRKQVSQYTLQLSTAKALGAKEFDIEKNTDNKGQ